MRWLLYAASALVFLAGFQLTVFTEQTATYFAWTIARPLTGAFLGASYWAAVPVEVIAARQSSWANARVAVPAIWLFTALTLVATLLHFDQFHFSSPIASAQGAAWFWLAIYAGVPVAMLITIRPVGLPRRYGCASRSSHKVSACSWSAWVSSLRRTS
ncbi:MAG: hypothetical protein AUH76_07035 [Candidatus Rokubacteria bacterium 13_1_40CM_4_67_11]|nr:MAG: hypothetical protein AUH76_07035 [Candidatus Rokubacteria bacterium 13_1_40CM_4_67_11]